MKSKTKSKKRRTLVHIDSDTEDDPIIEITELKRKPRVSTQMLVNKHEPLFTIELAVHKKKIDQVRSWMQAALRNTGPNILILTGPSGSGKTATVKCIAKELKCSLIEWENITDSSIFDSVFNASFENESTADSFCKFMETNGTGSLLAFNNNKNFGSFIVIEDYPNVIHDRVRSKVWNVFQEYTQYQIALPIIIIVSDVNSSTEMNDLSITKKDLLPSDILISKSCVEISFNPIAKTFIAKALNRICSLEGINISREQIDALSVSCGGDIRTAIHAVQFSKLSGNSMVDFQRDADISLFHAIGKILHCKREPTEALCEGMLDENLYYLKRNQLKFHPEEIFESLSIGGQFFMSFVHENYTMYCNPDDSEHVIGSSYLSDSDLLAPNFQIAKLLPSYMVSVALRGLLFSWSSNRIVPKLGFFQFKKPDYWQAEKLKRENIHGIGQFVESINETRTQSLGLCLSHNYGKRALSTEIIPYMGIMNRYSSPMSKLNNGYRGFLSKINNYNLKLRSYQVREDYFNDLSLDEYESSSGFNPNEFHHSSQLSLEELYLLDDDIEN